MTPARYRILLLLLLAPVVLACDALIGWWDPASRSFFDDMADDNAAICRWRAAGGEARLPNAAAGSPAPHALYFYGNSVVREGFDQDALTHTLGHPCYNFGLSGAGIGDAGLVTPYLQPGEKLVIGANAFLFDARTDKFDSARAPGRPWRPYAFAQGRELRNLLKDRTLRLARALVRLDAGRLRPSPAGVQYRYGRRRSASELEDLKKSVFAKYSPIDEAHWRGGLQAFDRLCERLHAQGVGVLVVVMPDAAPSELHAFMTGPLPELRAICARRGIPVIDGGEPAIPAEHFYDFGHLLAAGRATLTQFTGERLARLLEKPAP